MKNRPQLQFNLLDPLLVDTFAGGGGASTGFEMALNRAVDIAINHDPEALAMHLANHPETHHITKDVWKVDPAKVTNGRPVAIAWFSPDCKDFSKAKGGKPVRKKIRGLAWIMVKWAKLPLHLKPRLMFLENVEEFQDWGPLLADNTRDPARKGETFKRFIAQLRFLGYEVDWRELRCCDYGAPTIRKRLFLVARCDGRPIVWPAPTHGKPTSPDVLSGKLKPWRTAAECIDFSLPCHSIFLTKKQAKQYGVKRPLAPATMARIARGIFKFVINNPQPFIVKVNHTGDNGFRGQSIDEPIQTITAKHPYALVSPHVTKFRTGATGHEVTEPLHTITAGPKKNPAGAAHALGLVSATIVNCANSKTTGRAPNTWPPEEPLRTITSAGGFAAVKADLERVPTFKEWHAKTKAQGGTRKEYNALYRPTKKALKKNEALASFITEHANASSQRNMPINEPLRTICGQVKGGHFAKVTAFLAKHNDGHASPGSSLDEPVAGVNKTALIAAQLVGVGGRAGQSRPRNVNEPIHTTTTKADTAVVTSHLEKLYTSARRGASVEAPMPTVTATGTHIAEVRAFLVKYYGCVRESGQSLDEPMHTIRSKACMGLVTVEGEDYVITDIGMRMLEPRELFNAQGFPPDYEIEHVIIDGKRKRLPKHAQVRMCGNSVPPVMPDALISANAPELSRHKRRRAA